MGYTSLAIILQESFHMIITSMGTDEIDFGEHYKIGSFRILAHCFFMSCPSSQRDNYGWLSKAWPTVCLAIQCLNKHFSSPVGSSCISSGYKQIKAKFSTLCPPLAWKLWSFVYFLMCSFNHPLARFNSNSLQEK